MQCQHICCVLVLLSQLLKLTLLSNGQTRGDNSANFEHGRIPLPDSNCAKGNRACQEDIISLDAIKALHKQIDDDQSGNIDMSESHEFFRDELQNTDGFERQSIFHGKDDKISVEDLWHAWKQSLVYNWTVDDVVDWLISSVNLPQYAARFKDKLVNGSFLPRVAVNTHHYISKELGIKNAVHKHKLSVKAMDVILFGPTKKVHSLLRDVILVTSVTLAIGGCWFAMQQYKKSQQQMKRMMRELDTLQKTEDALTDLNEKLKKATKEQTVVVKEKSDIEAKYREEIVKAKQEAERLKKERQGSDLEEKSRLELAEEELIQVRAALKQAEKELELQWARGAPLDLQHWLQFTFELEQQLFLAKQQAAQKQFGSARDACEKMRRKRTSILGTLRMAQSISIDDIDKRIVLARMALEEIKHDIQERQLRWLAVERLCGFPVRSNPGLVQLENILYGDGGIQSRPTSLVTPLTVNEEDEDCPPHYSIATGIRSNLGDLKKHHVTMGSLHSLMKSSSQLLVNVAPHKWESQETIKSSATPSSTTPSSTTPSSTTNLSPLITFHLENGPVSAHIQESTFSQSSLMIDNSQVTRSKSMTGLSTIQNGSGIPCLDNAPAAIKSESLSVVHSGSDSNLLLMLSKQRRSVGLSNQDDDSDAKSLDPKRHTKLKRKLRLKIPKFFRKMD